MRKNKYIRIEKDILKEVDKVAASLGVTTCHLIEHAVSTEVRSLMPLFDSARKELIVTNVRMEETINHNIHAAAHHMKLCHRLFIEHCIKKAITDPFLSKDEITPRVLGRHKKVESV